MNSWKIATIVTITVVAVALICASAIAFLNTPVTSNTGVYTNYPNGMMNGYGNYPATVPQQPTTTTPPSATTPTTPVTPSTTTGILTINDAATIAQNYLTQTGNTNLAVREVEEYTQNFYVLIYEKDTGTGAFELLIDKYTGAIYPEQGPNMMWNTKYGMMSNGFFGCLTTYTGNNYGYGGMGRSMMSWFTGTTTQTTATMTVTADQAKANAQQYLNTYYPGTTAGDVDAFYGYYHVEVLNAGNMYGMLSVNGYNGQVWYHTWHGIYIQQVKIS